MKRSKQIISLFIAISFLGIIVPNVIPTTQNNPTSTYQVSPHSAEYDDSLLARNLSTFLTYDVQDGEALGFQFSSNSTYNYISAANPEDNENLSYQQNNLGFQYKIEKFISPDNATNFRLNHYTSSKDPLNFEDTYEWNYAHTSSYKKNATYVFFPNDIYITDIHQNNSAFLQSWIDRTYISGINMEYFYNVIDDTFYQDNFSVNVENTTNLYGSYYASWIIS